MENISQTQRSSRKTSAAGASPWPSLVSADVKYIVLDDEIHPCHSLYRCALEMEQCNPRLVASRKKTEYEERLHLIVRDDPGHLH